MRDIKRIDRILEKIGGYWKSNPDMRFGQMLINLNIAPDTQLRGTSFWNIEDDLIEKTLEDRK
jgi:uncharacterized protein YihD (DUF1040 family)